MTILEAANVLTIALKRYQLYSDGLFISATRKALHNGDWSKHFRHSTKNNFWCICYLIGCGKHVTIWFVSSLKLRGRKERVDHSFILLGVQSLNGINSNSGQL